MTLLRTTNLTRRFGDLVAVENVSMELNEGEVLGLIGANGAGKTTLIRMILGLLGPSSGTIEVMDLPPSEVDPSYLGYVPQGLGLYPDLTVEENLEFSAGAYSVPPIELESELAAVRDQPVGEISLGLQRRLAFAAVLGHHPGLLILDEPTSGVGPLGRIGLWDRIRKEAESGSGVLISTHYMEEAEQCDRVLMMAFGGVVASGTVDEIVGGRTTVYISGADPTAVSSSNLVAIPDGTGWRVPGISSHEAKKRFGDVDLEERPMDFEEAFIGLSR